MEAVISPERSVNLYEIHGAISQKAVTFIIVAMETRILPG
jgi:hypothetical protein